MYVYREIHYRYYMDILYICMLYMLYIYFIYIYIYTYIYIDPGDTLKQETTATNINIFSLTFI